MLPTESKELILVRGLPGCGKTTFANLMFALADSKYGVKQICADDCWEVPYTQETFTPELCGKAHRTCILTVAGWMHNNVQVVIVHNTFTTNIEMDPYIELAKKFGYKIHTIIVENRHNSKSVHGVPEDVIGKMLERFTVDL